MAEPSSDTLKVNTDVWIDSAAAFDLLTKLPKISFGVPLIFTTVENEGECMVQIELRESINRALVSTTTQLKVVYYLMGYKAALGEHLGT